MGSSIATFVIIVLACLLAYGLLSRREQERAPYRRLVIVLAIVAMVGLGAVYYVETQSIQTSPSDSIVVPTPHILTPQAGMSCLDIMTQYINALGPTANQPKNLHGYESLLQQHTIGRIAPPPQATLTSSDLTQWITAALPASAHNVYSTTLTFAGLRDYYNTAVAKLGMVVIPNASLVLPDGTATQDYCWDGIETRVAYPPQGGTYTLSLLFPAQDEVP